MSKEEIKNVSTTHTTNIMRSIINETSVTKEQAEIDLYQLSELQKNNSK